MKGSRERNGRCMLTMSGILLPAVLLLGLSAPLQQDRRGVTVMFYNTENLFDTIDGPDLDEEFLPDADRRWSGYRYYRKLDNIARVIVSGSDPEPPLVVGLCELESQAVLDDLVNLTILGKAGYRAVAAETNDSRGIRTGLLYRDLPDPIVVNSCDVILDGETLKTRKHLVASFAICSDTVTFIVAHWPSRRGGVVATVREREAAAAALRILYDSLPERNKVVIMGDMNCSPLESPVCKSLGAVPEENCSPMDELINTSTMEHYRGKGSYKFQGAWEMFDQIIVNRELYKGESGLSYVRSSFTVSVNRFLLIEDPTYRGQKPWSTWAGPVYSGGFSDHLPVTVRLELR